MYVVKTIQMHVWPVRAAKEPVQSLTAPYSLSLPTGKKGLDLPPNYPPR